MCLEVCDSRQKYMRDGSVTKFQIITENALKLNRECESFRKLVLFCRNNSIARDF